MSDIVEKRKILCELAELYLDTCDDNYINVNDGILNSFGIDAKNFLLFLALSYSKNDMLTPFSYDIDIPEEEIEKFINFEFNKIHRLNKSKVEIGKVILNDANKIYNLKYFDDDFETITEDNNGDQSIDLTKFL